MSADFRAGAWCPVCGMKSVVATPDRLVCSSPQCDWTVSRTQAAEEKVLAGPPTLRGARLARFKVGG